jgi:hypothetical protein
MKEWHHVLIWSRPSGSRCSRYNDRQRRVELTMSPHPNNFLMV